MPPYRTIPSNEEPDNYIQLKSFKGRSGIPFSIAVSLGDTCLCENFEL
jgi:hypothetical protein